MPLIHEYTEQDFLNAIARTKLLFCTDQELCEALNYSTNTKNIGRIGGNNVILKRALLAYMDTTYAKAISPEIDLMSVLEDYIQASDYVSMFHRQKYFIKKKNTDKFAALIEYFCIGRTDCNDKQLIDNLKTMESAEVGIYNYVLPIMLLILWEVIPTFHTKKPGDIEDIRSEGKKMFNTIEDAIKASKILRRFPIIDICRKEFEECSKKNSSEPANRLRLIHSLSVILNVLYNNSSPESILETMESIDFGCIDICGYWEDKIINRKYDKDVPEEHRDRPTFWHFESDDNSIYNVRQVVMDQYGPKHYRTFEVYILDPEHAQFISKEAIAKVIENGKVPDDMQFIVKLKTASPVELELTCCSDNKWFESRKMTKVTDVDKCKNLFDNLVSSQDDIIYEAIDNASAITEDYVYFRKPDSNHFYKVGRLEHFEENTDIYDLALYKSKDRLFVGCPATLKYIDITDEEKLASKGVSIVEWHEKIQS